MSLLVPALLSIAVTAPAETAVVHLPEVIVTGTRIEQPVSKVPAAVTVVRSSRYETTREMSLKDALDGVPGVLAQSRSGAQDVRITIRGYGARGNGERSNAGNMRGIRVLTDGIPASEPDGRTALDLVDLGLADRVEVSRSNVSALYGNASGGVVHLRTNLGFAAPFARAELRGGSFGYHREQGTVGFAAGRARGVIALANSTYDGWREHSGASQALAQFRMTAPTGEEGRLMVIADGTSDLFRFPGALTAAQLAADPQQANAGFAARNERRRNRIGRLATTYDQRFARAHDLFLTAFVEPKALQRSERNRFRDFTRFHVGGSGVWTMDQPLGKGVTGQTTAGFDEAFQDGAIQFWNVIPWGARGTTQVADKREGANSAGVFAQQSVTFHERWNATVALRYDRLWYISQDFLDPALDASRHFTHLTPKGSVAWLGRDHTVFAAIGGGVEAPAFNEIDPPAPYDATTSLNPFLEPMISTTYEVGARGALPHAFRYDAALYWIEVRNDIVPFNGGAYFFTAGRSRRRGAELGLDWLPLAPLSLRGSLTASHNEYVEYRNDLGDFAGREVPGLPPLTWYAAARCELPRGVAADVSVEGASRYFADDANAAATFGWGIVNAGLSAKRAIGDVELSAFLNGANLLDKTYVASVFINGVDGQYYEAGMPRSFSLGLSVSFR